MILNQILILFTIVVVGFISGKTGYLSEGVKDYVGKIIIKITLPLLIFTNIYAIDFSQNSQMLYNGTIVFCFTFILMGIMFTFSSIWAKILKLRADSKLVYMLNSAFGNVGFMGFPLFEALYGPEGLFYAVIYNGVSDLLLWSFGVYLFNKDKGMNSKEVLKRVINPNIVSIMLVISVLILRIKIPDILFEAFKGMGRTTSYLSMLFIGLALTEVDMKGFYKKTSLYAFTFSKMFLMPLIFSILIIFLNGLLGLNEISKTVLILEASMPCMTMVTVLAKEFNSDYKSSAEHIFATTVVAILSVPLISHFITQFSRMF